MLNSHQDTQNGQRIKRFELQVSAELANFLENEALPGTGIQTETFWQSFSDLVHDLAPKNRELLQIRLDMQKKIDNWHIQNRDRPHDHNAYKTFLAEIGYLVPEGDAFVIETSNIDPEIATIPGPQLVVPVTNARYALNAANARWGSLYDGLYGTDAMGTPPQSTEYDRGRGSRVVARARVFLDEAFPISGTSHADARRYHIRRGQLMIDDMPLQEPEKFIGYRGHPRAPEAVVLKNNSLHVELVFDRTDRIGARDQAGLADVRLESAITAIVDCEDSVACVDAQDKVTAYRNWLGLMRGDLQETFSKGGETLTRTLSSDLILTGSDGLEVTLKGRALMLVRNVGHLMTNPAVLDRDGLEVPEGLMDAMITVLIAMHDLKKTNGLRNSTAGSVYVVKPKLHGPEETAFTDQIFSRVEQSLGLASNTVKLGIMDEERRTSVNLKECIRVAKNRVAFINTGFLDRTGDEIHTSMEAGPFSRKDFIKRKSWIAAYEQRNVDIGLECGLSGQAQIGKGMWAMPDKMAAMLEAKIEHPQAGATTAWVPSPTAATLHALHYHRIDVFAVQAKLQSGGRRAHVDGILDIPLARFQKWNKEQIKSEVSNNAQGILGYVVRWIDHGVGCSKVPDINDIGLMEDRATCRISAQHVANWLHHDVISRDEVMEIMKQMALIVDGQNAASPGYQPMAPNFDGIAFKASCELVLDGRIHPSGYTEPVLHARRIEWKAELSH